MGLKNMSTNDKIISMYKGGESAADISKSLGVPIDAVKGVIEKYIPDYKNYQNFTPTESETKGVKGILNTPVSELFKKKGKTTKFESTLNLTLGEKGYVDNQVAAVAKMLTNEKPVQEIAEFFNIEIGDVKAVETKLDEHNKLLKAYEESIPVPKEEPECDIDEDTELLITRAKIVIPKTDKPHPENKPQNTSEQTPIVNKPVNTEGLTPKEKMDLFVKQQVAENKRRLNEFSTELNNINSKLEAIQSDTEEIEANIDSFVDKINELQSLKTTYEKRKNDLEQQKVQLADNIRSINADNEQFLQYV